jgi:4-diphosphocytidyl-2-C-methyl-D-erythritol kinase
VSAGREGEWREQPAFAKINLGLRVLGRRPDGYHELESVLVPLELHDLLRGRTARRDSFRCSDPTLPADGGNLVLMARDAWRVSAARAGLPGAVQAVELELEKRIPAGAGLGGGSSDAAACLRLLDQLFPPGLGVEELRRLALTVGSDVPFFVQLDWAHVTGRGEILTPIPPFFRDAVVVAWPGLHVSTAWAYSRLSASLKKQGSCATFKGSQAFVAEVGAAAGWPGNDFEPVVFASHPTLADLKRFLLAAGARYAAMSGSGSAVFGLFDSAQSASCVTQQLSSRYPFAVLTRPVG